MVFENCMFPLATNTSVQRLRTRPHDIAKQIQIRSCHLTGKLTYVSWESRSGRPKATGPDRVSVESKKELQDSKVLDQIVKATDTRVRLYSDGAPAWPSLCDVKGIKNFQVKHNKFEFVKRLPGMKKPASVVVVGTQVIDRWW